MNLIVILLFIPVLGINAYWKLEWNDEFDQDQLDQAKWKIDEGDNKTCDPWKIQRLNCYINNKRNIRLTDGTVALTAMYEKHQNKNYTSAWIKTKRSFTYGRIDIRAALPIGKMLSPWVKLLPPKFAHIDGGAKRQVNVFYNDQSNYIRYGINLGKNINGYIENFPTTGNLNEFHTYSFEWNETDLIWKFDNIEANWLNVSQITTFLRDPIIVMFALRVGGNPFRHLMLTLEDVIDWSCSQFILDYVRYYQWVNEDPGNLVHLGKPDRKSPAVSCKVVMDEIRPKPNKESITMNLTAIISGICLIVLVALIPLIIWLVIRMKTMKKPEPRTYDIDNYYDDVNTYPNGQMELYEDVGKDNNYYYTDPDKAYDNNNKRSTNYYSTPEQSSPPIVTTNDQYYITMTAKMFKPREYLEIEHEYKRENTKI